MKWWFNQTSYSGSGPLDEERRSNNKQCEPCNAVWMTFLVLVACLAAVTICWQYQRLNELQLKMEYLSDMIEGQSSAHLAHQETRTLTAAASTERTRQPIITVSIFIYWFIDPIANKKLLIN